MHILIRTDSANEDFQQLVLLLDKDLHQRDGDEHAFYSQFNKTVDIKNVVVCYDGDHPVGCGAFKAFDAETVEIKRMYVRPSHRGQGIGLKLVAALERWAKELNYRSAVLETGKKQPEAITLYEKAGYTRIKNFGQYENVENSICMKKML